MADPEPGKPQKPILYRTGIFTRLANYLKLFIHLLRDRRVSWLLKLIPLAALLYIINPIDRLIPVVDDLVIAWLAVYLFVELSPPEIVAEHRKGIESVLVGRYRDANDEKPIDPKDVIEGEFHDEQDASGGRI